MKFRIKEARQAANLTQQQLAEMLGIKGTTLSGYEIGAHDPKSDTLVDIARICNTSVDYLLGIDRGTFDQALEAAEKQPAITDELSEDEERFISGFASLSASNRRLLLGILSLLLQEQKQDGGSQA